MPERHRHADAPRTRQPARRRPAARRAGPAGEQEQRAAEREAPEFKQHVPRRRGAAVVVGPVTVQPATTAAAASAPAASAAGGGRRQERRRVGGAARARALLRLRVAEGQEVRERVARGRAVFANLLGFGVGCLFWFVLVLFWFVLFWFWFVLVWFWFVLVWFLFVLIVGDPEKAEARGGWRGGWGLA
jgi:hypothetical protein